MPGEYSNDFSQPNIDRTIFEPQTDNYVSPVPHPSGGGPAGSYVAHFRSMYAGTSSPPLKNAPAPAPGGGITLTVPENLSIGPGSGESRSLYLDLAHLSSNSNFFLQGNEKLNAEVIFEMPAEAANTNPSYIWALGLLLKGGNTNTTGFQDEDSGDNLVGPTCQFFNGGNIHFHGTDYSGPTTSDPALVSSGQYSDYSDIDFHLSLSIWREPLKVTPPGQPINPPYPTGTATLSMIPKGHNHLHPQKPRSFTGKLYIQDRRTKQFYSDIEWINAIGFSVVIGQNNIKWVSLRIKQFTLSVTPVHGS